MPYAMTALWAVAGGQALRFGLGNARVWRSLAVGSLLMALSVLLPAVLGFFPEPHTGYALAVGSVVGITAVLVLSHSVRDYYTFTQTLDDQGRRLPTGLALAGIGVGLLLLLLGPEPTATVRQAIRIVENSNWVLLMLINIGLLGKIRGNLRGTPINKGFLALMAVFACIVLWKGSELYLDVYPVETFGASSPIRYGALSLCALAGNLLTAIGMGATFLYLARLLR